MVVTVYEFMKHFNEYIEMLKYEDIYLTENGKTIAKVSNPKDSAVDALTGILKSAAPDDLDKKDNRRPYIQPYRNIYYRKNLYQANGHKYKISD